MQEILAIVLIFGGGAMFLLAISPIGRAVADRIRSGAPSAATGDDSMRRLQEAQQVILDDLEAVRQELGEVQERLDFAERLLAKHREPERLPAGEGTKPPERGA